MFMAVVMVMVMVVVVVMVVMIVMIVVTMVMRQKMGVNSRRIVVYWGMVMFFGEARWACGVRLLLGIRFGIWLMVVYMLIVLMKCLRV